MTSSSEFREFGRAMIDYVADYLETIRDRPVLPSIKPGYLQPLVRYKSVKNTFEINIFFDPDPGGGSRDT